MRENRNNPFEHENNPKTLEEIFIDKYFSHESPSAYFKISSEAKLIEMSTPYSENLLDLLETKEGVLTKLGEMIAERIKNEVVVDLGCGAGFMREYAKLAGAKLYIGIDKSVESNNRVIDMTSEEMDKDLEDIDDDNEQNQEVETLK